MSQKKYTQDLGESVKNIVTQKTWTTLESPVYVFHLFFSLSGPPG